MRRSSHLNIRLISTMRLLARLFGRHVRAQVEDFVGAIGKLVGLYLMKQYESKYGSEEEAARLASAVANELFGAPPGNEVGRQFLASNKQLVETHLRELKDEPRICEIVSVAAHSRMNVAGNSGTITPEM